MSTSQSKSAYKFRPGDVLQKRVGEEWVDFGRLSTKTVRNAVAGVNTGVWCGIESEWRIVRDGRTACPVHSDLPELPARPAHCSLPLPRLPEPDPCEWPDCGCKP